MKVRRRVSVKQYHYSFSEGLSDFRLEYLTTFYATYLWTFIQVIFPLFTPQTFTIHVLILSIRSFMALIHFPRRICLHHNF
jgi:hypothetical protein